jgi:hypothetical protein
MSAFEFRGVRELDPRTALQAIVAKYPQGGSEKWLRIFEAICVERPDLRRLIVQQTFAATLLELSATERR